MRRDDREKAQAQLNQRTADIIKALKYLESGDVREGINLLRISIGLGRLGAKIPATSGGGKHGLEALVRQWKQDLANMTDEGEGDAHET